MNSARISHTFVAIAAAALLVLPYSLVAQESELEATIRAALLSDPRTSQMSDAQIDAMVALLASGATEQGLTAEDFRFQPQQFDAPPADPQSAAPVDCGAMPQFFCNVNHAFGFDGSNPVIPVALGITSGLLILILGIMIERHYAHLHAARPPQKIQ